MNTKKYFLLAITLMLSSVIYAQSFKANAEKSELKWLGKKVTGQHNGQIKLKSGELTVKDNKLTNGNFVIDMTSITCEDLTDAGYNQKLVGHLKSDDFFGVEKFPTATLKITDAATFTNNVANVKGSLTIKGTTNPVEFAVTKNGNTYVAKVSVDRSKYDVRYGSGSFFQNLGDKAIDDIFTLEVKLVVE
jgi:polyisoprenoid-binding protein YceI